MMINDRINPPNAAPVPPFRIKYHKMPMIFNAIKMAMIAPMNLATIPPIQPSGKAHFGQSIV